MKLESKNGRNGTRERAIAVGLALPGTTRALAEEHLAELARLIESAGGEAVGTSIQDRRAPDPSTWVGKGKAEEIAAQVAETRATLVVFDDELSGAQVRNLEKIIPVKVIDRSMLILDIFARRARTREARTQVELAQLEYFLPRLTRQWTHLERQAGGIGTRGVGETQLEIDRRLIRRRIARLKDELAHIETTRRTQRKGRDEVFSIALVGYTNAGKSTLFNRLSAGDAFAMNQLFATLDPKAQKVAAELPMETIVIDTVGFIRKLPHHLVASFRSTMEEAVAADLVLHVIDGSHAGWEEQRDVGREVLADLGVDPGKTMEIFNKSDMQTVAEPLAVPDAIFVSALTGLGIDSLIARLRTLQLQSGSLFRLAIPASESKTIAALHELGTIVEHASEDSTMTFVAWVPERVAWRFRPFALSEETSPEAPPL